MEHAKDTVRRKRKDSSEKNNYLNDEKITVALAGNPNVGKSTLFNELTGLHQHTGNWSGKTVGCAEGECSIGNNQVKIIDLPGTYSLTPHSDEEAVARDFICSDIPDCIVVVCDATCLERNLILAIQILSCSKPVIVCVNLIDEASKAGISIDTDTLSSLLGVPCLSISARRKTGLEELESLLLNAKELSPSSVYPNDNDIANDAEAIAKKCVSTDEKYDTSRARRADKLITGKFTAFPLMLVTLAFIFWLTIEGANYPSRLLSSGALFIEEHLLEFMQRINMPQILTDILVMGIFRTVAWVVSVMLPPMAIFFPLFTLLEDLGYLPRVAFNLDRCFKKCDACGKQALTMCMGFGCNAAGVVGCRIIDSERERLIAMLTNVFVPCNGRFPTIIAMISIFLISGSGILGSVTSAALLTLFILFSVIMTLAVSKLLSVTLLKGAPSSFTLELPPYRRPQIAKVLIRSVLDRTLHILLRAVAVAAPAGLLIWILANVEVGSTTLLIHLSTFIDPIGRIMGLDGVILLAFILALPANEIVIPIILMAYSSSGSLVDYSSYSELRNILLANGWTTLTAICVIVFMLCHFPCSSTLITIKKETGKLRYAVIGAILPTLIGFILCVTLNALFQILNII